MSDALVSVILPVYNAEEVLHRCIDSILCQTYRNIEVLVIDDGSTDGSVSVARSIHDDRIVVIEAEHRGVSHARNIGLQKMNGQFFTFVDADDFVANTYVETMLSDIEEYQADIAFTRAKFYYLNEDFEYQESTNEKVYLANNKAVIEACFGLDENRCGYNASVWCRMFRTSFYLMNKELFDEQFTYGEDAKWLFPLVMRAERIVMDEKVVYHYNRVRGKYTDHAANIRYYTWRLSFYQGHGFPKQIISSTKKLLCENQFALLLKKYPTTKRFRERINLVGQCFGLMAWSLTRQKGWNLGRMKKILTIMLMRIGMPGKLVDWVWKLQRRR